RAKPARGGCRGAIPTALSSAQRRSLLREPEPNGPAGGLGGLRQQRAALRRPSTVDALPWQPRDRVRQRRARPELLSHTLRTAGQRHVLPGPLVLLPGRLGALRLAR